MKHMENDDALLNLETSSKPNSNIDAFKRLKKSKRNFYKIYDILHDIAIAKDVDAMSFAFKEKFCDVTNESGDDIFKFSNKIMDKHLTRLMIEFGKDYDAFGINFHRDIEAARYLLKLPNMHIDIINKLIISAAKCRYEVDIKLFLTVSEIHFNESIINEALIVASQNGKYNVVKQLLTVPGININAQDKLNITALIHASGKGHYQVVKLLLDFPGIDVNIKDSFGYTALFLASRRGHTNIVKLLLAMPGIEINERDDSC